MLKFLHLNGYYNNQKDPAKSLTLLIIGWGYRDRDVP
jgi:hypothetical protein